MKMNVLPLWFSHFFLDPYVKVSLMCEGRRLKKRKTSTKRNTLNPIYNEAIVFDVPPENIEQISLLIAVMDYDRLGVLHKSHGILKLFAWIVSNLNLLQDRKG